jgi:site-specific recombinase XerC
MANRKLLDQVSDVARFRHLSLRTEETYRNWIKRFILFHGKRHPRHLDAAAVRTFLTHLAVNENVSASTQNQAFNALLFLYRQVLHADMPNIEGVERARNSRKLPVVFTKAESNAVIARMKGNHRLIAALLYGAGLRIMEAVRLRVKDLDFGRNEIVVRDGKGERIESQCCLGRSNLACHCKSKPGANFTLMTWNMVMEMSICLTPWKENTKRPRLILPGSMCFPPRRFRQIRAREPSDGIMSRNSEFNER